MDHYFFPLSLICFMLCICYFIKFTVSFDHQAYLPDDVSITCGSVGTSAAHSASGRQWLGDTHPIFASSVQIKGKSTISSAVSADPIPYKAARISRSGFAYVFLVSPGEKFIRLHFNPTPCKGFQKYKDLFTAEAGPFTLLSNFSASLTADALGLTSIIKEFYISVQENQPLHIVFTPTSSLSRDTYAFLNGIEIITVPSGHSYFHADGDVGAQVVGRKSQHIYVDNSTALEMVRRVNIKRDSSVSSGDDIIDIFGMWGTVAGIKANQINNATWKIPVDMGFKYLIRLYFSNLGLKFLQEIGSVNFDVLINGVSAYNALELVRERDTNNITEYKDYMVTLNRHKDGVKHDILVSLQTYSEFIDKYGPFTGFEILKLSNHDNSLACPNPWHPARDLQPSSFQILHSALAHRNSFVTISIIIIALASIIIHKFGEIREAKFTEEENKPSWLCHRFSLTEMQLATKNFSHHLFIGDGGFGKVYKGLVDHGKETVAIKRLKASSSQGGHEFFNEIETLSELRHINIVSLIGYCNEQMEMILVYEYMAGGTLGDHLYKLARKGGSRASLTWKQRLNICIGAGRGLDYLHTGNGIIHRDVKALNILLDENLTPKFSDFGLVKHENLSNLQSHVSTAVKGTFGYLDPTYFSTGKLTRKSDVYAFGVVLLEVLCGRPVIDQRVSEAERNLRTWAEDKIREGEVELIVDSNLKQEISPNSLEAFVEIVERCLDNEPKKRPTMAQVVVQLEFSLEQQDTFELSMPKEIPIDASSTDETNLSAGEQATWIDERIPTSPPEEQTNYQIDAFTAHVYTTQADYDDLSYQRKKGRKVLSFKPSRIWPWDALRKRVKLSRKIENSISEICEEINLPKYDWSVIESATNHFSSSYMIGGSGHGSRYYKAVFHSEKIVAVKIFSASREVIKTILKVQKLRHRNILKLMGYCIHKGNMVLVHDFMENKSLDKFIFEKCKHLQWTQRFNIIMGIARGLSYLHRMRIIHRDLKPSHILLDINMNPKISDLDLAKSLEEEGSDEYTCSYMSHANSLNCKISTMSDVYSFGVVVLEIVSGRRYIHDSLQNTVTIARKLWLEENPLDMVDVSIRGDASAQLEEEDQEEFLKSIKVGLLCTQFEPNRRPTMACVIKLLEGEESVNQQEMEFLSLQEKDQSCNRDEDWTPNVSPDATP